MAVTDDASSLSDADYVQLGRWEEVTGNLEAITVTEGRVVVELSVGTLSYTTHTVEADRLQEALAGNEGRTVGILRTDATTDPLAITVE